MYDPTHLTVSYYFISYPMIVVVWNTGLTAYYSLRTGRQLELHRYTPSRKQED